MALRVFQMYAEGLGLAQIAKHPNRAGVPAPIPAKNRLHRAWSRYTILEMLHNERYRGVLVWDRTKKVRHPETGWKISKARPESEWTRVKVPNLRIVAEVVEGRACEKCRSQRAGASRRSRRAGSPRSPPLVRYDAQRRVDSASRHGLEQGVGQA